MRLEKRDIQDINTVLDNIGISGAVEARLFENNKSMFNEPQIFKTKEDFIEALRLLKGFEFENALNGSIGFRKKDNVNDYYHIQLYSFEGIEYSSEIEIGE